MDILPVGKLPPDLLRKIIEKAPISDPRVKLGPGIGLDCAIIDLGDRYLVLKTDPITFATEEIGWYAVQIIANDISTTGAKTKWLLATTLLPEGLTNEKLVTEISDQLFIACRQMGISFVNGHTEITHGIDRPILMCSAGAEISHDKLIIPSGAQPGDKIMLTKSIPIEGTALLAKEFPERLGGLLSEEDIETAKRYTHIPGIGISKDAEIAVKYGHITAMHDPTEGGLSSALWELSEACGRELRIRTSSIPISPISAKICNLFGLIPMNTIASGSLLFTASPESVDTIYEAMHMNGIPVTAIGNVMDTAGVSVFDETTNALIIRPDQDEIAKVFS